MRTENLIPTLPDTEKIRLERGRQRYTIKTDIAPGSFILRESELIAYMNEYSEGKPAYMLLRACDIEPTYEQVKNSGDGEIEAFRRGLHLSLKYIKNCYREWPELISAWKAAEGSLEPTKKREVDTYLEYAFPTFYKKIPELIESKIIEPTENGYSWNKSIKALKHLFDINGFSEYRSFLKYFTRQNGETFNYASIKNRDPYGKKPRDWPAIGAIFK